MSNVEINQVLQQMRNMASVAENGFRPEPGGGLSENGVSAPEFSKLITDSINKVNETQQVASELATAFEAGDPSVNLSEVMVAKQKASVSFQAMIQVRNNLISAYKEVMNMQV